MTREEKIKAIYKEMSNKQKTMGCKYLVYAKNKPDEIIEAIEEGKNFTLYFGDDDYAVSPSEEDYYECYNIKEVIGHPVMIGDVLDWIGDKRFYCGKCKKLVDGRDVSDDGLGREYYCDICNNDYIENTRDYIVLDRDKKRLPIDDQSDGCIDYVYSLIQKD